MLATVVTKILDFYKQYISPLIGSSCRFYPSCCDYSKEAIKVFGFVKGTCLSLKRILRCNQFFEGGYDPVQSPDDSEFKR